MDPIEQAAQATGGVSSGIAEGVGHARDATATAGDQAMRAGVELTQRNAETVQHVLQCGAKLAGRLSERFADQFGRAIGISGESAKEAAQKSSRNFQAIAHSGAALTEITQRLCEEWVEVAWTRMDRGFDRVDAFLQCRTPHDFTALQSEIMRDNMEAFLLYARKAGEHAARLAGEARRQSAKVTGDRKVA
jgi:hypothetical protein